MEKKVFVFSCMFVLGLSCFLFSFGTPATISFGLFLIVIAGIASLMKYVWYSIEEERLEPFFYFREKDRKYIPVIRTRGLESGKKRELKKLEHSNCSSPDEAIEFASRVIRVMRERNVDYEEKTGRKSMIT